LAARQVYELYGRRLYKGRRILVLFAFSTTSTAPQALRSTAFGLVRVFYDLHGFFCGAGEKVQLATVQHSSAQHKVAHVAQCNPRCTMYPTLLNVAHVARCGTCWLCGVRHPASRVGPRPGGVWSGISRDTSSALELSGVGRRWRCSRTRPIPLFTQNPSGLGVGSRLGGSGPVSAVTRAPQWSWRAWGGGDVPPRWAPRSH
jgi:hypothetical protein